MNTFSAGKLLSSQCAVNSRGARVLIVVLIVIGGLTAACVTPNLKNAEMAAREAAAVASMRTISTGEVQYMSQFGRYAASLAELGPPANGAPGASGADVIPAGLAQGEKDGFRFALKGDGKSYALTAEPSVFGNTGARSFYTDDTMIVHVHNGQGAATAQDPEFGKQ